MFRRSSFFTLAIVLLVVPVAFAQADYARSGPYLGIGFSGAVENFRNTGPLNFEDGVGLNARAGYRLPPRVAAEFAFEWIDAFDLNRTPVQLGLGRSL